MSIEDQVKIYLGDQVLFLILPPQTFSQVDHPGEVVIMFLIVFYLNLTQFRRLTTLGRLSGSGQRRERLIIRRCMPRLDQVFGKITMITWTRTRMMLI